MIASFTHSGLLALYASGRITDLRTEEDERCIAVLDLLATLHADEPLPGWLAPACLLGRGADYCVPVSATLFVAFRRDGGHIHDLRLISSAFEAPGGVLSAPPHLTRRPSHPGAIFRTLFLPSLRRSMADLARTLGVPQSSLYKFLAGNRRSVGAFSLGLSEVTGTSPDFWERLQGAHDVFVHARSPTPHIPLSALSDAIETGPSARRTRRLMGYAPVATILVTLLVAALPSPADAHEQQSVVDGRRVQPTPEMIRKLQGEHARERNPATAPPPSTHAKPKKEKGRNGEKKDEGLAQQNQ